MLSWIAAFGISYLFGAAGIFIGVLGCAIAFPRTTQLLFTTVAWPVLTLWLSMWMTILGWLFNICSFSFNSYKMCVYILAIPVGIFMAKCASDVRNIGSDKLRAAWNDMSNTGSKEE